MSIYIRSAGCISPQRSFKSENFWDPWENYEGSSRLKAIEPDYRQWIDPKMIRRMSRIIRMGVAAAANCLKEAGGIMPDAILTGTGYGCLEDTGIFLGKMVEQEEEMLTPTAFIQSTHNTVGAQIALILGCHGYNNTYVHRGFSFETALMDAMLLIREGDAGKVLVGAADEITDTSHEILSRFGLYKGGAVNGEGSAFFLLSKQKDQACICGLDAVRMIYEPEGVLDVSAQINKLLQSLKLNASDIDLLILGSYGDIQLNKPYSVIPSINFKHLCGEYPTASAFALWLTSEILKRGSLPEGFDLIDGKIGRVLIYNHYQNRQHSLILISAC